MSSFRGVKPKETEMKDEMKEEKLDVEKVQRAFDIPHVQQLNSIMFHVTKKKPWHFHMNFKLECHGNRHLFFYLFIRSSW